MQELSYCKQIARQLCTQYVDGIHRPKYYTVTLKSSLRVTQGHWKQNHWTDHTVIPFESMGTVSYSPFIVTMAVSVAILAIFSVKEWPEFEIWVWGPSKSLNGSIDFLLVRHCNYSSILYHLRVI